MLYRPLFSRFAVFAAVLFLLGGCSSGTVTKEDKGGDQLISITYAYVAATDKLGRPPKNAEELKPFLREHGDPDKLLVSPNDGEPYVIHWGTDPRLGGTEEEPMLRMVFAYEKTGSSGKRQTLMGVGNLQALTTEELQKAPFPKGFKPPS